MASLLYLITTILLVHHTHFASSQQNLPQMQWAEEQPQSAYTVYNGKIYAHPKKESSWSNLFSFDYLYNNPVVQTVLGWTESFYGSSPSNDTMKGASDEYHDAVGSQSHPRPSYYTGQQPPPPSNQYPGYYNSNKNVMPNYQPTYMQQQQQQPSPPPQPMNNGNKYPNYGGSQYLYPQYPQQPPPQLPSSYRPLTPEQQLYQQKQVQYQQQMYPQQFSSGSQYGAPQQPVSSFGQQQQQSPPPQQPYYGGSNYYGNPNVDIVNNLEAQGSVESILTQQPQERFYQPSSYQSQQSIQQSSPSLVAASAKNSFSMNDLDSKPSNLQSMYSESSTETVKDDMSASSSSSSSGSSSGAGMLEDNYPCPALNQWKWDGEYCIALGPYPTFACLPNDLVASGRIHICRNKVFFPNEP